MRPVFAFSLVLVCALSLAVGVKDSVWGGPYGDGPVYYLADHSGARAAQVTAALTAQEEQLVALEGERWAAAHVAAVLARAHLALAANQAPTGADAALRGEVGHLDLKTTDGVVVAW